MLRRAGAALLLLSAVGAEAQQARIVLRWREAPGAAAYELQIARDSGFVEVVLQTRTTTAGYRWEQLPTATHWWRVRTIDAEGRASEWSQPRNIAVDSVVPVLKAPNDNATWPCGAAVPFAAEPSTLVKEFVLQVSASKDFAAPREIRAKTPSFILTLEPGSWFWRISALDVRDKVTEPSPMRTLHVRVAAPRPKATADSVPGGTATLSWTAPECAVSYVLEAASEGGESVTLSSPGPTFAFKTAAVGDYRWRVAGLDAANRPGEWSAEQRFKAKLAAPALKSEVVEARVAEVTWAASPGAASYRVEVSSKPDFKAPEGVATVQGLTFRTPKLPPGSYTWRVTARDSAGKGSSTSELRTFEVKAAEPLAAPVVSRPVKDQVLGRRSDVEVAWSPVAEAVRYVVVLDGVAMPPVTGPASRLVGLAEGPHRVQVKAVGPPERDSALSAAVSFFAGVPEVAKAEVEQRGYQLAVTLLDEQGRPIEGAKPTFYLRQGQALDQRAEGTRYTMRWEPLDSGDDVLVVKERTFKQELRLSEPDLSPLRVAGLGGYFLNFGAVSSPGGGLSVSYTLPVLAQHLFVETRGVAYLARAQARFDAVGTVDATATLVPLAAMVGARQAFGGFEARVGAGPAATVAAVRVGADGETRVLPGVMAVGTVARRIGPGLLFAEVSGVYARLDSPLALLNAGGLGFSFGYAVAVPVGGR